MLKKRYAPSKHLQTPTRAQLIPIISSNKEITKYKEKKSTFRALFKMLIKNRRRERSESSSKRT